MLKPIDHSISATRLQLMQAALKCFARRGYAATSVQEIVDAARVSKPALYYYFKDKAGLFQAVVNSAHDERYRLIQEAARRGGGVAEQLTEILATIFEYSLRNRELMRLAFATAFAAAGDAPTQNKCREKGRRNFEFIKSLVQRGQATGELTEDFTPEELAMGIYGQLNSYVMIRLLVPDCPLDRKVARCIIELFMRGAARGRKAVNGAPRRVAISRTAPLQRDYED